MEKTAWKRISTLSKLFIDYFEAFVTKYIEKVKEEKKMIYSPKITVKFFSLLPRLPLSRCEKEGKVAQKRGGRKKTEKKRRNDRYCGSNSKRWGSNIQAAVRGCFGRKTKKGRNTRGKIFFETCETGDNKYRGGRLTSLLVRKVENNRSMNRNGWADY